jgi:anthranilate synthase
MRNSFGYTTEGGVRVVRNTEDLDPVTALNGVLGDIDTHRGAIFASGYEDPGRYSRWDIGFVNPPLQITARERSFNVEALNERGRALLLMSHEALKDCAHVTSIELSVDGILGTIAEMPDFFPEEERSRQPSVFSVLRTLTQFLYSNEDKHLGLYGAFGYDLVFQFEPIKLKLQRSREDTLLHLFLPDDIVVVDRRREEAFRYQYDFRLGEHGTSGKRDTCEQFEVVRGTRSEVTCDHKDGEFARTVERIIEGTRRGDFFEVVPSQVFSSGYPGTPRELYQVIRDMNPSPYEFLINLGTEQLVGASPEMFVRVEGNMVETCPISGTIKRGDTPVEDADQILELLNSGKDLQELTMCTDVDRNDKSRVCKPGTVRVVGRRMIEMYSRLIHTVDHVTGELIDGFDGFDALLSHMWACTLTGAPKPAAMQMVENLEKSSRRWYGGCVGMLRFDGSVNTGITIRTIHLCNGTASVRAGATTLCHSDPQDEERETRLKAEAFLNAVLGKPTNGQALYKVPQTGAGKRVLFVDCNDSFVHTLANYVRQTGAEVVTVRAEHALKVLDNVNPDLVFVSPGPGVPNDFGVPELIRTCAERGYPVFGVCLGLQGIVEAFGGKLHILHKPTHGESAEIKCEPKAMFAGFPRTFRAGRYHSLFVRVDELPGCFELLASMEVSSEQIAMAVQHQDFPLAAVQFHPESLLSLKDDLGLRLISQATGLLTK